MATTSYANKVREGMAKKASEAGTGKGNPLSWSPEIGTHKIRILPPIGPKFPKDTMSSSEEAMFYHTHKFHWIPNSLEDIKDNKKGKFLWVPKDFDHNGQKMHCPICEAVTQWYSVGRADKDQSLLDLGGALKQKRQFFVNIIRYTDNGPEFRVLVDNTNEGKLMKVITAAMGFPFFRDIDDNWVDKNSTEYDPDKNYFDLLDPEVGYDFKIIKEKTGVNNWDISYEKSFVMEKAPRPLDDADRELMGKRVDLVTYVPVEKNYAVVKATLDNLLGSAPESEPEEVKDTPKPKASPAPVQKISKAPQATNDDEAVDDMLKELDDEA